MTFHCRACRSERTVTVLSLGSTPLANALLDPAEAATPENTYPLTLVRCEQCTLLQIDETVPPEQLFSHYAYFSSFSDGMVAHAASIAARLVAERLLGRSSLVVEVASNDGYLLQHYHKAGIPVLGVEPAKNIAAVAEERGIRTEAAFFSEKYAAALAARGDRADVLHANNVLAHVADLPGFVRGISIVLKDDGIAVIEVPYVLDFIDRLEFDTIYHEHLCYFSLTALDRLFAAQGLRIVRVERLPIHGGSIRIVAVRAASGTSASGPDVERLLADDFLKGVDRPETYATFQARVETWKKTIVRMLKGLKQEGHRVAAYGASAKGATLLNYTGLGRETLDFVADRSTYKQGKLMPGVHVPIRPATALKDEMPDYVLLLTWNFADEILTQQAEYLNRGGKFIIPIPEPRVVQR